MRFRAFSLAVLLGLAMPAHAQDELEPTVRISYNSPRLDPSVIRPVRPFDGYEAWLSPEDFPDHFFDSLTRFQGWGTDASLLIGDDGSLQDCEVRIWRDNTEEALGRVCELLRDRAHFRYALDQSGTPLPTSLTLNLSFGVAPGGIPSPPNPGMRPANWQNTPPALREEDVLLLPEDPSLFIEAAPAAWVEVNRRGRVEQCTITQSSGSDAGDVEICRRLRRARFNPAQTPDGDRVPQGTLIRFGIE